VRTDLPGADLSGANLLKADPARIGFDRRQVCRAQPTSRGAGERHRIFSLRLVNANFQGAQLSQNVTLRGANFRREIHGPPDLGVAILRETDLSVRRSFRRRIFPPPLCPRAEPPASKQTKTPK